MPFGFASSDPFSTLYSLQSVAGLVFLAFLLTLMRVMPPLLPSGAGSGILEGRAILPPLAFFTGGSILILRAVETISHILSLDCLDDGFKASFLACPRVPCAAASGQHVADFTCINKGLPQLSYALYSNSKRAENLRLRD